MVSKKILRFFIIFFNKFYLSDTDHQYRHDDPVRGIQSISEPDQFSTAGSYHVYEPIPSGFQNADRCRTVLCHHRSIAWEGLQQDGLTDNEWEELNHIAEISEILVQMGQENYRVEPTEEYKSFLPVLPRLSSELPFDHFSNDFYHHFVHFSYIVI